VPPATGENCSGTGKGRSPFGNVSDTLRRGDARKLINKKLAVVGTTLDGDQTLLNVQTLKSDVSSKYDNEMVSLVLEKVDNYEARKARMQRRQEIRTTKTLDHLSNDDSQDEEPNNLLLKSDTIQSGDEGSHSDSGSDFSEKKPQKIQIKKVALKGSAEPKPVKAPPVPFNPNVEAVSTSLSRMQKFRYLKDDNSE